MVTLQSFASPYCVFIFLFILLISTRLNYAVISCEFETMGKFAGWERNSEARLVRGSDAENATFVPTSNGLLITRDDGRTFSNRTMEHGLPGNDVIEVFLSPNAAVYVVTTRGLACSVDGGETFTGTKIGSESEEIRDVTTDGSRLLILTGKHLYISIDAGLHFSVSSLDEFAALSSSSFERLALFEDHLYIIGRRHLLISHDNGASFHRSAHFQDNFAEIDQLLVNEHNVYVTTTDGQLHVSRDCAKTFISRHVQGLSHSNTSFRLVSATNGSVYIVTEDGGKYVSQDNEESFHKFRRAMKKRVAPAVAAGIMVGAATVVLGFASFMRDTFCKQFQVCYRGEVRHECSMYWRC